MQEVVHIALRGRRQIRNFHVRTTLSSCA